MKKTFSLFLLVSVMCFPESAFLSQVEEGQKGILKVVCCDYDITEYKKFTRDFENETDKGAKLLEFVRKEERGAFKTFVLNKLYRYFNVKAREEWCSSYLAKYPEDRVVLECAAMIYEESNLVEKALPLYEMLMSKELMSLDSYGNYASCLLQKKGHDQDSMKKVWNIIKEWQNRLPEKDQIFFIPKREHEELREVDFLGATYDFLLKKIKEHNHIDLLLEIQNFKREEANPTLPKILITMAYQQHILPTELHKVCVVNTGETILSCKSSKKEFDPNNIERAQLKQYLEAFNSYIEKQKEFLEIIKKNVDDLGFVS